MAIADNPFADWLEAEPQAAYFSYQGDWGAPRQRQYYRNQYSDIYNEYLGLLGKQLRAGTQPNEKFVDFLSGFDWNKRFQQLPLSQRPGANRFSDFVPPVSWLVPR